MQSSGMTMVKSHTRTRRGDLRDARLLKDYRISCVLRHGKLESMRISLGAAWTILLLAGALTACSPGENEIELSDNRYTQSGSVETPDDRRADRDLAGRPYGHAAIAILSILGRRLAHRCIRR